MLTTKLSPAVSLKSWPFKTATMKMSCYPMRSVFFVKKTRKAMEKVKNLKPDIVVLDLEDSIAKDDKSRMKELYLNALRNKLFNEVKVYVRSSSLDSIGEVIEDLNTFAGSGIEGFLLPKLQDEKEVVEVAMHFGKWLAIWQFCTENGQGPAVIFNSVFLQDSLKPLVLRF